jgi:hypothetical protein
MLATQSLLRLAYNGPDGFPRVIPIGFLWTGEQIIVCTAPSSPKARALAARPEVALTIDTDQGTASRSLSVRGVAAIEIVDGVPDEYLAASAKNMDAEQARQFEASAVDVQADGPDHHRAAVGTLLRLRRFTYYQASCSSWSRTPGPPGDN